MELAVLAVVRTVVELRPGECPESVPVLLRTTFASQTRLFTKEHKVVNRLMLLGTSTHFFH